MNGEDERDDIQVLMPASRRYQDPFFGGGSTVVYPEQPETALARKDSWCAKSVLTEALKTREKVENLRALTAISSNHTTSINMWLAQRSGAEKRAEVTTKFEAFKQESTLSTIFGYFTKIVRIQMTTEMRIY